MPDAQRAEIAKLEAMHAEHPQGRIFTHLAEAYRKAGELERAREVLSLGLDQHPDYSSAHVVLARVLRDQGEDESAIAEFRRVLELDGHNLVALRALGDMARDAGRMTEAREHYRRLLEVEPSDSDVRERLEELDRATEGAPAGTTAEAAFDEPAAAPAFDNAPLDALDEPAGETFSAEEPGAMAPGMGDALETFDLPPLEPETVEAETVEAETFEAETFEAAPLEAETFEPAPLDGGGADAMGLDALSDEPMTDLPGLEDAPGDQPEPLPGLDDEPGAEPEPLPGLPPLEGEDAGWVEGGAGEETASFPEPAWITPDDGEDEPPLPPGDSGEPAVHTETIAQIYARQGLYDRAAEVYRQLLRERPDDPALRSRLEEMEALADTPAPGGVAPLPGLETSEFEAPADVAPLAGLESDDVDPGTGLRPMEAVPSLDHLPEDAVRDVPAPPAEETIAAWDEPAGDEAGTAGDADEAEPAPWAETMAEPESAEPESSELESSEGESSELESSEPESSEPESSEPEPEPWATAEPEAEPEPAPWAPEEAATEPWAPAAEEEASDPESEAEAIESVWTGAGGASGGEESPYAWAADAETEPDASEPIGSYFQSLLGWGGEGRSGDETRSDAAEEAAAPRDGGARSGPAAERDEGEGPDDDDMDTFRSWLESLKQ